MRVEPRGTSIGRVVLGVVTLSVLAAGFWVWRPFAPEEAPSTPMAKPRPRLELLLAAPADQGAAHPKPRSPLNSEQLGTRAAQASATPFVDNVDYGQAMLLSGCEVHHKSGDDLVQGETLSMIKAVDPSGELLKRLRAEREAPDSQCAGLGDQDFRRIPELMAAAARQGVSQARSWLLNRHFARLTSGLGTSTRGTPEHTLLLAEAQALLPEALSLAETGDTDAAMAASQLLIMNRSGRSELAESARWLLVALQVPDHGFNPWTDLFQGEPYSTLSPTEVMQATERARQVFLRCCTEPASEKPGLSPFS